MNSLHYAYNLAVTGYPLPNTFYVKGGNTELLQLKNFSFLVGEIFFETGFFKRKRVFEVFELASSCATEAREGFD